MKDYFYLRNLEVMFEDYALQTLRVDLEESEFSCILDADDALHLLQWFDKHRAKIEAMAADEPEKPVE